MLYDTRFRYGFTLILITIAMLVLANWATSAFGFIPVGFGRYATAGTLFAGATLATRDAIQDILGRKAVIIVIVGGAILSFAIATPEIAIASGVAFALSELLDFAIYTPLRSKSKLGDKRWAVAVMTSNIVGAVIDSIVFIGIAFGMSLVSENLIGQMIGKLWATILYLVLGVLLANRKSDL